MTVAFLNERGHDILKAYHHQLCQPGHSRGALQPNMIDHSSGTMTQRTLTASLQWTIQLEDRDVQEHAGSDRQSQQNSLHLSWIVSQSNPVPKDPISLVSLLLP
jgi:hypothetical protein